MQIWDRVEPLKAAPFLGGVVTIGNFDGLHLGHQALLKQAGSLAGPKIVLTFDPHPLQVLYPERGLKRLFPREDVVEQLPNYGIDLLVILPFTTEFAKQQPGDFLNSCVGDPFRPRHLVTGYDFAFGQGRSGNLDFIREWGLASGLQVDVVPALTVEGDVVSSRRIRELIENGEVAAAARLLGRPFYLRGEVVSGAGRGAGIGVPTLNQRVVNEIIPATGVYVTRTRNADRVLPSVTNIGFNPTFPDKSGLKVETHVIGSTVEWRGQRVDVQFVDKLRDEMKFPTIEDLKKQIQSDILKAKAILGV